MGHFAPRVALYRAGKKWTMHIVPKIFDSVFRILSYYPTVSYGKQILPKKLIPTHNYVKGRVMHISVLCHTFLIEFDRTSQEVVGFNRFWQDLIGFNHIWVDFIGFNRRKRWDPKGDATENHVHKSRITLGITIFSKSAQVPDKRITRHSGPLAIPCKSANE